MTPPTTHAPISGAGDERGPRTRAAIPMRFVVALTVVVTGFAAAVALWMYWLAGLLG